MMPYGEGPGPGGNNGPVNYMNNSSNSNSGESQINYPQQNRGQPPPNMVITKKKDPKTYLNVLGHILRITTIQHFINVKVLSDYNVDIF